MIYITGDTHGRFERLFDFCKKQKTTKEDVVIILGDAGINYWGDIRDNISKARLSELPVTLLCIYGNHEMRPETISSYRLERFMSGLVMYEPAYPNLLFAMDGQIYSFYDGCNRYDCLAIGGAYSVDKHYRLENGWQWFEYEQPDDRTKQLVELQCRDRMVDIVLSHTCPKKYMPVEAFISGIDQSTVDNSTEEWLDKVEEMCNYQKWYCGHFHIEKSIDRMCFMFEDFVVLGDRMY